MAEHPPPDPSKLLALWMEWEGGGVAPGDLVKNFKKGGLRELLEAEAARSTADTPSA